MLNKCSGTVISKILSLKRYYETNHIFRLIKIKSSSVNFKGKLLIKVHFLRWLDRGIFKQNNVQKEELIYVLTLTTTSKEVDICNEDIYVLYIKDLYTSKIVSVLFS